jgi:UDP-N-acetylmuramoyl-L-alanyl-D-glutamate--2,6-diaminopimelate ligase
VPAVVPTAGALEEAGIVSETDVARSSRHRSQPPEGATDAPRAPAAAQGGAVGDDPRLHATARSRSRSVPLAALLEDVEVLVTMGDLGAVSVSDVAFDTRRVRPGALYCCVPGRRVDGHDLAGEAVAAGAVALLCERPVPLDVPQACVGPGRVRPAMARVAAAFHGHPARALTTVGVTGTNGKTTVASLLGGILEAAGLRPRVLGTLTGARTTPEAPDLQAALAAARDEGARAVAMEVSSHALVEHRVDAIRFDCAVFTNLSRDHLDFHGTMEAYFAAKASLFEPERAAAGVVNADDAYGRRLLERARVPLRAFSLADARDLDLRPDGAVFTLEGRRVRLGLPGLPNVANALAAAAAAAVVGVAPEAVVEGLESAKPVPGRFERVEAGQGFSVLVDYAHTPTALEQVLRTARTLSPGGRVLVVFGCGGERDRGKRPEMGAVAARLADLVVVTSDNPRGEDPWAIIEDVLAGVGGSGAVVVEPDREAAIARALGAAGDHDVVVVAGKGHETGQETATGVIPFDDREVVRRLLGLGAGEGRR